jgi:Fic-DOC domain mobile mystery protein B
LTDLFRVPDDATPLEPDEQVGLLQTWIATRADLNEAEQANIEAGNAWALRRLDHDILTSGFTRRLHKEMFGQVWAWAGRFRLTHRNIGVAADQIAVLLGQRLLDVRHWIDHRTFEPDEIAIRLHHQIVSIHPFPNGNGRHARLMADLLARQLGREPFSWGGRDLAPVGTLRRRYIAALREADAGDVVPLLTFARA